MAVTVIFLYIFVLVLLSANIERFSVSQMRAFSFISFFYVLIYVSKRLSGNIKV